MAAHLADLLAWIWRKLDARESKVARRNLELVYPELLPSQREELHAGSCAPPPARRWKPCASGPARPPKTWHGCASAMARTLYDAALASGRGLIVAAPHFGNWELLNQWLSSRGPIAIVYAPPESAVGDAFLQRVRSADNIQQVRAEGPAVRQLWKVLKEGGAVGILPDQQPKQGDGEFAPFFGVQALTMTLVSRLAERTGATVLLAWCERSGPTWNSPCTWNRRRPTIADPDLVVATAALNAVVERIARRDPAQYQWTYKRYSMRSTGSGELNPYKEADPTA